MAGILLAAGCGDEGEQPSVGEALTAALDTFEAESRRGEDVVCGMCWKEVGHESKAACL